MLLEAKSLKDNSIEYFAQSVILHKIIIPLKFNFNNSPLRNVRKFNKPFLIMPILRQTERMLTKS